MRTGLVFIHGAGLGDWIWDDLVSELNVPSLKATFPSPDENGSRGTLTLEDYASHVRAQIENWDEVENHILIAHSLGGVVGTEVASKLPTVGGFLGICAAIPTNRQSFLSTLPQPQRLVISMLMRLMGTKPPDKQIADVLCNGLTADQTRRVVDSWINESISVYKNKTTNTLDCPTGYVTTLLDKEFSQKQMKRMALNLDDAEVFQIETGHMPMLQRPTELARTIERFLSSIGSCLAPKTACSRSA